MRSCVVFRAELRMRRQMRLINHFGGKLDGRWWAVVRGEVVTVTTKLDAVFWSTLTLEGDEQVVPAIAKLHVSVAVPPNPAPPIERL